MELWPKFGGFVAIRESAEAGVIFPISLFLVVCESVFDREKPRMGVWAAVALPG
jgi:hypothetical protein